MPRYNALEVAFPVVSVGQAESSYLGLWGTAFYIGTGMFVTARHVIEAAQKTVDSGTARHLAIGQPEKASGDNQEWVFATFTDYEKHPDLDAALFHVGDAFESMHAPPWTLQSRDLLSNIVTLGYPYALDPQHKVINVRAIKGHIIGTGKQLFPGPAFRSYELSFLAPRGLSGAPLLTDTPTPMICGMIIGNRSHEMEVASSHETIKDNDGTVTYTKVEVMHIGIAIQQGELAFASFELIGGTIADHLAMNRLLKFLNAA